MVCKRAYSHGMRTKKGSTIQIALRVPADWIARTDRLTSLLSQPGMEATRTDVFRSAIARGLSDLEALDPPPKARRAGRAEKKVA